MPYPEAGGKRSELQPPEGIAVQELQNAFANIGLLNSARSAENLHRIITEELWRKCKKKDGSEFQSFPEWVTRALPEGLGLDNQRTAEFLRTLLLDLGRVDIWAQTLEYIRVRRGRPREFVQDDIFRPFYHVSRASNAYDQKICRLRTKAPNIHRLLLAGEIDLDEALTAAGILRRESNLVYRLRRMLAEFKELGSDGQLQVLELLWSHTGSEARADFLANVPLRPDAA